MTGKLVIFCVGAEALSRNSVSNAAAISKSLLLLTCTSMPSGDEQLQDDDQALVGMTHLKVFQSSGAAHVLQHELLVSSRAAGLDVTPRARVQNANAFSGALVIATVNNQEALIMMVQLCVCYRSSN